MNEPKVRIVELEPVRVASAWGYGTAPDVVAWNKLGAWMRSLGLEAAGRRFFGFDNPCPAPGQVRYGYEGWVTLEDEEATPSGDVRLDDFDGGCYAVIRCTLEDLADAWKWLFDWRKRNGIAPAFHRALEECLAPPVAGQSPLFDLYLPIARLVG
jgi:DNA gyrase inhibitor GyrI